MNGPQETAVVFECAGAELVGILHPGSPDARIGVLIVVGGPQYRVGSHRQFVLMARALAAQGFPVLRFDYRGMGDSGGVYAGFEGVHEDIRAAVDIFLRQSPGLERVVLFGLCDAASAVLMYTDTRVGGLILANPWVRTDRGEARTYLRHYYGARLFEGAFWRKLLGGRLNVLRSLRDFLGKLGKARAGRSEGESRGAGQFQQRMLQGLKDFRGPVLLLISGRDLTAREFMDLCTESAPWRTAMAQHNVSVRTLADADHTFSARAALEQANAYCCQWLNEACSGHLQ